MDNDATCTVCDKKIYAADLKQAIGHSYHRWCFRCTKCNNTLTLGREKAHEGKAYCARCHQSEFGATGYRGGTVSGTIVTQDNPSSSTSSASKFCSHCGTAASGKFCGNCGEIQ
mmetsp:Transcript_31390/g.49026  ORF Transcript_31390/g.49026 Transcript_31390/m.49026 type:complete len:114 (+) Transcript_31390:1721-2062(+)